MVRAAEVVADVAARVGDELRPLVRAAVVEDADRAVALAHHDERPAGDLLRHEVARVRHLARVAEEAPGVGEEALALEREDLLAQVHVAMDAIVFDQIGRSHAAARDDLTLKQIGAKRQSWPPRAGGIDARGRACACVVVDR